MYHLVQRLRSFSPLVLGLAVPALLIGCAPTPGQSGQPLATQAQAPTPTVTVRNVPSPSAFAEPSISASPGASPGGGAPAEVPPANAGTRSFTIQMTNDLRYGPADETVPLGSTVVWTNSTSVQHTVTDNPSEAQDKTHAVLPPGAQPWDSGLIDPGKTFQRVFTVAGSYTYFCIPHEAAGMVGHIVVTG